MQEGHPYSSLYGRVPRIFDVLHEILGLDSQRLGQEAFQVHGVLHHASGSTAGILLSPKCNWWGFSPSLSAAAILAMSEMLNSAKEAGVF